MSEEEEERPARLPKTFSPVRMEAFSDGVMAVIITIMVLELRPPTDSPDITTLWQEVGAKFLVYVLSFVFIGIYWNNHHHLLRTTARIDGAVMWANLHLLFWLSLIPATTAWAGDYPRSAGPAVTYGAVALLAGIAYYILVRFIIRANKGTDIARVLGRDVKGTISPIIYAVGMALALVPDIGSVLSYLTYASVAVTWFIPDRRLVGR